MDSNDKAKHRAQYLRLSRGQEQQRTAAWRRGLPLRSAL